MTGGKGWKRRQYFEWCSSIGIAMKIQEKFVVTKAY